MGDQHIYDETTETKLVKQINMQGNKTMPRTLIAMVYALLSHKLSWTRIINSKFRWLEQNELKWKVKKE